MKSASGEKTQKLPLSLKIIHGGTQGFDAPNVIVIGQKDAVLVDVPGSLSQGHRVVAEILESERHLKYIFITHGHPDHHFSAVVFAQAFPDVEIIAVPTVCASVARSIPGRLPAISKMRGSNSPRYCIVPKPYRESFLELEGEKLEILGPMVGDHPEITPIYIPSLDTIIASDVVFNGIHLFMGHHKTPEARKGWVDAIDQLIALKPKTVIAGHKVASLPDSPDSLQRCRDYLVGYEEVLSRANSPAQFVSELQKRFPDTVDMMDGFVLDNAGKLFDKIRKK